VDRVAGRIGAPYIGFPGDFARVTAHDAAVGEGRHMDDARRRVLGEGRRRDMVPCVDRPVAGRGRDRRQPVPVGEVEHDVGHPAMPIDGDARIGEAFGLQMARLVAGISDGTISAPGANSAMLSMIGALCAPGTNMICRSYATVTGVIRISRCFATRWPGSAASRHGP